MPHLCAHFRLTRPDRKEAKAEDKGEGKNKVGEDEGEAVEDSDNEFKMFQTSKEALHCHRYKGFGFQHTESDFCHAMCCTRRPLKVPLPKCVEMLLLRGSGAWMLSHRYRRLFPSYGVQGMWVLIARSCLGNH